MIYKIIVFLIINFVGLGLGSVFTSKGVPSDWYMELSKAPWTPPGWVFGAAWTLIMICFAFYMAYAWKMIRDRKKLLGLFIFQWILNFSWNPVFFSLHYVSFGLIIISLLTLLIAYMTFSYRSTLKTYTLLILPYLIWLVLATSLNAYILLNN